MVSAFLHGAQSIWWMSEKQQAHYHNLFPFLAEQNSVVLSSVFDDDFFVKIKQLRGKYPQETRTTWLVLGSPSWVKGTAAAEQWCQDNGKDYEVVWNLPYAEMLEKLAASRGLAFLPNGSDTCPRLVIEAKLLGCELHLNEHVQHADEIWFDTDDVLDTESYLYAARERFWSTVKRSMDWRPTISAYTTALNVERMGYPWRASIECMLGFSDELVVLDGGSDDGSYGMLLEWAAKEPKLKVHQLTRDWKAPGFALLDGQQKAEARRLCSGDFCWQMDIDEVVHERDWDKIRATVQDFPRVVDLVALPVIEFWGDKGKVRVDVNPWKWRLSRNLPHITHGLPSSMRRTDETGQLRSLGSDGCDYIHAETLQPIPFGTFMSEEVEQARYAALAGNGEALDAYEQWLNVIAERAPVVYHYSWWDLERKICNYRDFWTDFWEDLYGVKRERTNMFFDKPWSEVSDAEITEMATRLESELGGWIFHKPVDFGKQTPSVSINLPHPFEGI
jgi:glycosyltransferase involved in cell wall biosynthesis